MDGFIAESVHSPVHMSETAFDTLCKRWSTLENSEWVTWALKAGRGKRTGKQVHTNDRWRGREAKSNAGWYTSADEGVAHEDRPLLLQMGLLQT